MSSDESSKKIVFKKMSRKTLRKRHASESEDEEEEDQDVK